MTLPLRVEDMTDEQIRAMEPGDELDLRALQFYSSFKMAKENFRIMDKPAGDLFLVDKVRCGEYWYPDGPVETRLDIYPAYRVSRDDGAAMRMWKALCEWIRDLSKEEDADYYIQNAKTSDDELFVCSLSMWMPSGKYETDGSPIMDGFDLDASSTDLTHAIAILAALAAKWKRENGK